MLTKQENNGALMLFIVTMANDQPTDTDLLHLTFEVERERRNLISVIKTEMFQKIRNW